jgi:hypothetical protein
MNLKLLIGIALFVIGLITAVVGITGVGFRDQAVDTAAVMSEERSQQPLETALGNMAIPAIAGLSLAVGGLLIGLSMGNWKHPRTTLEPGDRVVDPEGYHKMKHV